MLALTTSEVIQFPIMGLNVLRENTREAARRAREAAALVRQAIGKRTAGRVFLSRGKPVNPNHLCVALRRFGETYDPPITAKTLRQFVVSTLLDLGYDLETIRRMTGHRSDAIWAYRQLRGSHVRSAAESIAAKLKGARTNGHPRKKPNKN